jgi:transcriptional regulator
MVNPKLVEKQPQVLRLRLAQETRQTSLSDCLFVSRAEVWVMEKAARVRLGKRWNSFPLSHNPDCGC